MSGASHLQDQRWAWAPNLFGWLELRSQPALQRAVHQFPLMFFAISSMAGVLLGLFFPVNGWVGSILWFATIAICGYWMVLRQSERAWLIAALIFLPLFASRQSNVLSDYDSASILSNATEDYQPAIIEATVDRPAILRRHPLADMPSRRLSSPWETHLEVTVGQARFGQAYRPATGRLLVAVDGDLSERRPGDRLQIYGSMRRFLGPTNPGERDLREVYRRRGLHARIDVDTADQIVVLESSNRPFSKAVGSFGARSRELLLQHTTESAGPLAIALVIGQREFVDPETRDLLLVTGTAHLLSVSGLHLAIIVLLAKIVAFPFRPSPKAEFFWILFVCVVYVAVTGGRPPVMRAALLIAALLLATILRRPSQPLNTLAGAGIVLLYLNPHNATGVGVQLSFLAVATLLLCGRRSRSDSAVVQRAKEQEERLQQLADSSQPAVFRYMRWCGVRLGQAAWFSMCVTATSMPLVWYHFHVVSPVSVLTNVCLSPLLIFALGSGVATVFVGFVSPTAAGLCGMVCSAFLWMMQQVITFSAAIPYGHFWLPSPPAFWVAVYYFVLIWSLLWGDSRNAKWLRRSWILIWGLVAWALATWPAKLDEGAIEATFVDVGHGTSVVLRLSENDVWLYDCGRLANDNGSSRDIDATLWSLGVTRLNGVVLSHADSDHYNAIPGVLKRFRVDQIVTPPGMLDQDEGGALEPIRVAIEQSGVPIREVSAGETLVSSGHEMQVLHPPSQHVEGNDNANSLVLRIDNQARVLLLPGDLEPPGTQMLINQPRPSPGGILMAPHHGSLTMDAEAVLQWARPRETIVSGGRRAKRPEVSKMLAITGSGVHVTANVGAIRVLIDRQGDTEVRSWIESPW